MGNLDMAVERAETERPVVPKRALPIDIRKTEEVGHSPLKRMARNLRDRPDAALNCFQAGQQLDIARNVSSVISMDLPRKFLETMAPVEMMASV